MEEPPPLDATTLSKLPNAFMIFSLKIVN